MFARLFAIASLVALVAASNSHLAARDQCSTGAINCCESTYEPSEVQKAFSQIGLGNIIADISGLTGTGCSPFSIVGVANSGSTCSQQPVCCNSNLFSGISVGCSPINIS